MCWRVHAVFGFIMHLPQPHVQPLRSRSTNRITCAKTVFFMSRTPAGRRIRARVVRAMVLLVVGLTAVYVFVGDRTVWGEWISVMPPVLWVLALSPGVVLLRSPMLLLVLALFMIITSEWPRFGGSRVPAGGTIRVVSWNIGSGFGGWAEAVAPLKPDIVLVQESAAPSVLPEGFHWYGALDPGTLSRFPATVLPSERIGAWTDPQLLLMEISGRKCWWPTFA